MTARRPPTPRPRPAARSNATPARTSEATAAAPRKRAKAPSGTPRGGARPGGGTSGRPASRPASARPAVRPDRTGRRPGHRPPVIRPATALIGVLVVLTLLVAPYVRPWVGQRSQITAAQNDVAALQQRVADLKVERARWDDPFYVKTQARQRLGYVLPGEIAYSVLDDTAQSESADPREASVAVPDRDASRPWYGTLWRSIETAGDPTTEQVASGSD